MLISAVTPKGAAGKDGRLECGDQILSVCFKVADFVEVKYFCLESPSGYN